MGGTTGEDEGREELALGSEEDFQPAEEVRGGKMKEHLGKSKEDKKEDERKISEEHKRKETGRKKAKEDEGR
jgi:hypothetical protein